MSSNSDKPLAIVVEFAKVSVLAEPAKPILPSNVAPSSKTVFLAPNTVIAFSPGVAEPTVAPIAKMLALLPLMI